MQLFTEGDQLAWHMPDCSEPRPVVVALVVPACHDVDAAVRKGLGEAAWASFKRGKATSRGHQTYVVAVLRGPGKAARYYWPPVLELRRPGGA